MADPIIPKIIGVKCADASIGEYVIVRNLTRGGKLTGKITGTDRNINFNPQKEELTWLDEDLIQAEIRGRLQGVKQEKIRQGGAKILLVGAADTTTPGVEL